jgi:hypothetical protein
MGKKIILQKIGKSIKKEQLYEESVFLKNLKFYYSWTLLLNMREKNMASRPLTNDQRSKELYRIAYQCAETKNTVGCNNNCAACPLNVHLYVDDARDATLIKTSAAMDYGKATIAVAQRNANNRLDNILQFVRIVLIGVLLFSAVYFPVSCFKNIGNKISEEKQLSEEEQYAIDRILALKPPEETYKTTPKITQQILASLDLTYRAVFMANWDTSNDDLVNCIDAAITFYCDYYIHYDEDCRIIWNYNPNTNWSHLFCKVPDGYGDWLYVECTSNAKDLYSAMMQYVWGFAYDPRYDKDVTIHGEQIYNGTYIWRW